MRTLFAISWPSAFIPLLCSSLSAAEVIPDPAAVAMPSEVSAEARGEVVSVLVTTLAPIGVHQSLAIQATELIAQAIAGRPGFEVKTMADVHSILGLQGSQQLLGCPGASCVPESFDPATARFLVTGSIGLVGASITVSLNLIATDGRVVRARVSVVVVNSERLRAELRRAVLELFAWSEEKRERFVLPADREPSFAVFDLTASGLDPALGGELTHLISKELEGIPGARVVTRDDIEAMLKLESDKQLLGCSDDTGCLVEIGGALGVSYLVAGSVGQLGGTFIISLRLIDPARGSVEHRLTESFTASQEQLMGAVRHAARELVGVAADQPGALRLTSNENGAALFIDGERVGLLPTAPVGELGAGRHAVRVAKEDFLDWSSDVYVDPGAETSLAARLQPVPRKWYESWVVWTVAGGAFAAVVAGTITAVAVTQQNADAARTHSLDFEIQLPAR